eukprot:g65298.t1
MIVWEWNNFNTQEAYSPQHTQQLETAYTQFLQDRKVPTCVISCIRQIDGKLQSHEESVVRPASFWLPTPSSGLAAQHASQQASHPSPPDAPLPPGFASPGPIPVRLPPLPAPPAHGHSHSSVAPAQTTFLSQQSSWELAEMIAAGARSNMQIKKTESEICCESQPLGKSCSWQPGLPRVLGNVHLLTHG